MPDSTKQREIAESVFDRNQRREAEINDALKQEAARHAATVQNMYRLRALRLARDAKANNEQAARSVKRTEQLSDYLVGADDKRLRKNEAKCFRRFLI